MSNSILDDFTITKRIFFPRYKKFPNPFWIQTNDVQLSCFYKKNEFNSKTIIIFHHGNEVVSDYFDVFVPELTKRNYNVFISEYRNFSMSNGTPSLINHIEDIKTIIKALNVPFKDVIVYGKAIGSLYAIHAVTLFPDISTLIIDSGIGDAYKRLERRVSHEDIDVTENEMKSEVLKYFDTKTKLNNYKGKTLIVRRNSNLKQTDANEIYEWANMPKKLKVFKIDIHEDIFSTSIDEYFNTIEEFINQ